MLVHEHCTRNSDIIKAATKKAAPHAASARIVKLPDECPKIMAHYLGFLYGARLLTHIYDSANPGGYKADAYELLARLYVLSEHLQDSVFRNVVVDEIIRLRTLKTPNSNDPKTATTHSPTTRPANIIYQGTAAGSPTRRLLVDLNLRWGQEHWHTPDVDPAFLFDFMRAYFKAAKASEQKLDNVRQAELKAADYHV